MSAPLCRRGLLALLGAVLLAGCSLTLIDEFDKDTLDATFAVARKVDEFYARLLDRPAGDRRYAELSDAYNAIEADLNSLVLRNKVRPYNEDSVTIVTNALTLWQKYKAGHKADDGYYTDGKIGLHRHRLQRLFAYAIRAEVPKPAPDDNG